MTADGPRPTRDAAETKVGAAFERLRERCVDKDFVSQERLDVVARERLSAFPWRGQFTPGLVGILLDTYARPGATVLDPFAGSGTTVAEAARRGLPSIGTEVNPAALELARIFALAGLPPAQREHALAQAERRLTARLPPEAGGVSGAPASDLRDEVARRYADCSSAWEASIVAVTMMLAMGDSRTLDSGRLRRAFRQVTDVVTSLPAAVTACSVHLADARALPVAAGSVDLIVTSPPYINVFNYHQNYRPAIESLGWNVLSAAQTEIGSNRKHRQNRFRTVVQYALDIMLAIREFRRVCRPGATMIIVIGRESRVRGVAFANGDLVGCLAELTPGVDFVRWQERSFVNRFGEKICEEILVFRISAAADAEDFDPLPLAAEAGRQMLVASRPQAYSAEAAADIDDAIASSHTVRPSPAFAPVRTGQPARACTGEAACPGPCGGGGGRESNPPTARHAAHWF